MNKIAQDLKMKVESMKETENQWNSGNETFTNLSSKYRCKLHQ